VPIADSDIKFFLSGGAGNTDPNASLGGIISSTQITAASLHNLFDVVSGAESAAGDVEYRGLYVKNDHGSITWLDVFLWIQANTPHVNTTVAIALAGEGVNATMETIANENTAPSGESFTAPASKAAGLSLGNLTPGQFYGIWVRWTVTAGAAAASADNVILEVEGDTTA
jgi:hypothetical protein